MKCRSQLCGNMVNWVRGPALGSIPGQALLSAASPRRFALSRSLWVHACAIEPGTRNTSETGMKECEEIVVGQIRHALETTDNEQPRDVSKHSKVIFDTLTCSGVATGMKFPVRLILGVISKKALGKGLGKPTLS